MGRGRYAREGGTQRSAGRLRGRGNGKGRRSKKDGEKHLTLPGWLPHSRCCASKPHRATCVNKRNDGVLVPRLCAPPDPRPFLFPALRKSNPRTLSILVRFARCTPTVVNELARFAHAHRQAAVHRHACVAPRSGRTRTNKGEVKMR